MSLSKQATTIFNYHKLGMVYDENNIDNYRININNYLMDMVQWFGQDQKKYGIMIYQIFQFMGIYHGIFNDKQNSLFGMDGIRFLYW